MHETCHANKGQIVIFARKTCSGHEKQISRWHAIYLLRHWELAFLSPPGSTIYQVVTSFGQKRFARWKKSSSEKCSRGREKVAWSSLDFRPRPEIQIGSHREKKGQSIRDRGLIVWQLHFEEGPFMVARPRIERKLYPKWILNVPFLALTKSQITINVRYDESAPQFGEFFSRKRVT